LVRWYAAPRWRKRLWGKRERSLDHPDDGCDAGSVSLWWQRRRVFGKHSEALHDRIGSGHDYIGSGHDYIGSGHDHIGSGDDHIGSGDDHIGSARECAGSPG
jgi:hypothetical protein